MSTGSGSGQGSGIGRILKFADKKYKEDDFVIPAQDTKGHSERIYYRVQPGMMRDLKVVLASKRFPFRTIGDIGRLGTKLVIEMLKTMEPMPSVSGQVDSIIKIVRDEEFHLEFISTFDQMGRTINRYIGEGQENQARRMLVDIREEIKKMPTGYWRSKYWKELHQKFGHLLKCAGVSMSKGVEDSEGEDVVDGEDDGIRE